MEEKKYTEGKVFRRILQYAKVYKLWIFLSFFLSFLTVVLSLTLPILMGKGIDHLPGKGKTDFSGLFRILLIMLLILVLTVFFQWCMNQVNTYLSYKLVEDLRRNCIHHMQKLPIAYYDKEKPGDLLSRLTTDIEQFSQGILMGLNQFLQAVLTVIETAVFLFILEWKIAVILLLITPLSYFIAKFIAKRAYIYFQRQSKERGETSSFTTEVVGNIKLIQAFQKEEDMEKLYREKNEKMSRSSMQANFYSSLVNPLTRFLNALGYALVAGIGGYLAILGMLSVGSLSSLLAYATQYAKPFNDITSVITELQNSLASASRVFSFLDEKPMDRTKETQELGAEISGKVALSHVDFSYQKEQKLITNFNLEVEPGQTIAIVGPTGCGKTTLINLLMRFYPPNQGEIYLDGFPYEKIKEASLRRAYGMVLQETWLKSDTVFENIRYGKEDASLEEVKEACQRAHCHHFIMQLPKGYDTVLSEDGGNLSQGQKQLLCIARVMLMDPAILILDEATSSIDTRTEQKVQSAFQEMLKGRTAFIVAHRLSTIQNADCILVMKDGNIIEKGSHNALLRENGFYKELYESQFQAN